MEYELENLVEIIIKKANKPLEAEIKELKTKLNELVGGQNFISNKQDKMVNDYNTVLTKRKKLKKNLISLTNALMNRRKKVITKNLN